MKNESKMHKKVFLYTVSSEILESVAVGSCGGRCYRQLQKEFVNNNSRMRFNLKGNGLDLKGKQVSSKILLCPFNSHNAVVGKG